MKENPERIEAKVKTVMENRKNDRKRNRTLI